MPFCWLLTDNRPGNRTQGLGVLEALGWPYQEILLEWTRLAALPNRVPVSPFSRIASASRAVLAPPWPDVVIGVGRRAAPLVLWLKRQHPLIFAIHLMRPDMPWQHFDLLAIPHHDNPPPLPNVLATMGSPHRVTPLALQRAALGADTLFPGLPRPFWTVLVGGDSKHGTFTPDDARRLGQSVTRLVAQQGGSALVTTSRRTSAKALQVLRQEMQSVPLYFWPWQPEGINPYIPMLGAADGVMVTEDSVAMLSEATTTGKPLYLFPFQTKKPFRSFHDSLKQAGILKALPQDGQHQPWTYTPPNVAMQVAQVIRERMGTGE